MAFRSIIPSLGITLALGLQPVLAEDAETPVIDRVEVRMIYENTGKLSKDISGQVDQIVAADPTEGSSIQMLVNVVVKSKPDWLYQNDPLLHVKATSKLSSEGGPKIVDEQFHITYIGETGEMVRSIVVDHGCEGFSLEAYVTAGEKRTSEFKKSFSVTCGD